MAGIVGYGANVPSYRIKVEEIAKVWGDNPDSISNGLIVNEKSVPSSDEDTATIAVTAARYALARAQIDPQDIGAVYVGSESHPYAVKPTATIVAEAIGATPDMTAADLEFACKAGTAGIQATMGLVDSGMIKYGLAIGADTSQGAPGDVWNTLLLLVVQLISLVIKTPLQTLEPHIVTLQTLLIFTEEKVSLTQVMEEDSLVTQLTSNMYSVQQKDCSKKPILKWKIMIMLFSINLTVNFT